MNYKGYEIHAIYINKEAWEIDDNGNEIEVDDESRTFAGYVINQEQFYLNLDDVDIVKDNDDEIYHADAGFSSVADAKNYIDECIELEEIQKEKDIKNEVRA